MTVTPLPSYDHGASDRPLLGETIGENLDRMTCSGSPISRPPSTRNREHCA
jgi:hypothetical protein